MRLDNIQSTVPVTSSVMMNSNDACPIKDCEKRAFADQLCLRLSETVADTDDDCRDCVNKYSQSPYYEFKRQKQNT